MSMRSALRYAFITTATLVGLAVVSTLAFAMYVTAGMHAVSDVSGTVSGTGVSAPVSVIRDARGVPHIRAQNEHDLFFAQGYVEASDRLFQLDLIRRFEYGELAEILGKPALAADENARTVPVRQIVATQWSRLDSREQALLQAFADGINTAMTREPVPVEFRLLAYRPQPWQAQDSLAVGMSTVLVLTDTWDDIVKRIGTDPALSDSCYDAPVTLGLRAIADPSRCTSRVAFAKELRDSRPPIGSNAWGAGAARSLTGRALIANDPHLNLGIPGVWYLVDLQAPGYHAAGATLAGTPGIILGHNRNVAWGVTNGAVTSLSVFDAPRQLDNAAWQRETFHVRFGGDVTKRYYRTPQLFGVTLKGSRFALVRWNAYADPHSPLVTFDALDRARSIEDAQRAIRVFPGPTLNFVIGDTSGRATYALAGDIPNDPLWAQGIHPASDLSKHYPRIPFDQLPHVNASRDAVVWTSNNKMYGPNYRYRLSPEFEPPYRAHRVAELLRARSKYGVAYFSSMQMDTLSLPERDLAKIIAERAASLDLSPAQQSAVKELRTWDGRFTPNSRAASIAFSLRHQFILHDSGIVRALVNVRGDGQIPQFALTALTDPHAMHPWGVAGAVTVKHPLAPLGIGFLNGSTFAGDGDAYSVHVQNNGTSQSFRAVWDVGNWDAGGIIIPQGESGQPGSLHYTDEATNWVTGHLIPLPFTTAAVNAAAHATLTLQP